jgi:Flp pilus assembly protein TadD
MAQQQQAEAVAAYRGAYDLVPGRRTLHTLFRATVAAGQSEAGYTLMRAWVESNPQDLGSLHLFAQALMLEKRWAEARDVYEKLQANGTEDVIMLNNLAVCYQHLGDARALPAAEAAYALAPKDPSVADTYGWILLEQGRAEEALALLREAFARASTSPAIRYHIGLALSRLGRAAEASEEIEAALASAEAFSGREEATSLLEQLRAKLRN